MIVIAQIMAAFLATLVIVKSYADFKQHKENITMLAFWSGAWILIVAIAFFPEIIHWITDCFGGKRTGIGTIFGTALIFIFFVVYRIYLKTSRVERRLNELVRKIALKNSEKNN